MIKNKLFVLGLGLVINTILADEVNLKGKDGFNLYGDFVEANVTSNKGVLMLHQCNADRSMYEDLAASLAKSGISSMSLDFRGYGDSTTDEVSFAAIRSKATSREHYMEMTNKVGIGAHRSDDVEIAYQYLLKKLGNHGNISLIGASCGGGQSIILAQKHKPESFIFFSSGMNQATIDQFKKVSDVPALIIVSQGDEYTFKSSNRIFLDAENQQSRLISYKGDAHGFPLFKQDPNLKAVMVEWFKLNFATTGS